MHKILITQGSQMCVFRWVMTALQPTVLGGAS